MLLAENQPFTESAAERGLEGTMEQGKVEHQLDLIKKSQR